MTSLAASGQLQNAIKYCTKVHKTGEAGKESTNSATVKRGIKKFYPDIQAELIFSHISYFQSGFIDVRKRPTNAASDGFGSNFSGVAFCLPHQLVSFLFTFDEQ